MYGLGGVTILFLLLPFASAGTPCTVESYPDTTVILLDTYTSQDWTAVDGDQDNMTWVVGGEACVETAETTCSNLQQNFLITPYVSRDPAQPSVITILVDFSEGNCMSSPCSTDFNLLIYQAEMESSTESLNIRNYINVSMVPNGTEISYTLPDPNQGFYLAFEEGSACVIINRVRVLYRRCLEVINEFTQYRLSLSGVTTNGTCVENAVMSDSSPLSAICQNDGTYNFTSGCDCRAGYQPGNNICMACQENFFKNSAGNGECVRCPSNSSNVGTNNTECECDDNHRRQDPSDVHSSCSECVDDFYLSNGRCTECPTGSTSRGSADVECTCGDGLATMTGSLTTTSDNCSRCRADYYRDGGNCVMCPERSSRLFERDESMCLCSHNSATLEDRSITTAGQNCAGCASGFFNNATQSSLECVPCPTNSMSMSASDTSCVCNPGTQVSGSGDTTVFEPCSGCAAGFFRLDGSCIACPRNSERTSSTADEGECPCLDRYYRDPNFVRQDCLPVIGFSSATLVLSEGSGDIEIQISRSGEGSDVDVNFERQSDGAERENISRTISTAILTHMIPLVTSTNNDIGLENNVTVHLSILSVPPSVLFIASNSTPYYRNIRVVIQDDDVVEVGFAESSVSLSSSSTMVAVTTNRGIANDLTLSISSDTDGVLRSSTVTFPSGDSSRTMNVMIDISGLGPGDTVELQLDYDGPYQRVAVGGDSTSRTISISLEGFPVGAIIGISAAGAGLAILLLLIVILCLCVCRLRVNRQGFYHTYEDKVSEPPTMLRYSASLRSISSQTVIPPSEDKTASKENEFYV